MRGGGRRREDRRPGENAMGIPEERTSGLSNKFLLKYAFGEEIVLGAKMGV